MAIHEILKNGARGGRPPKPKSATPQVDGLPNFYKSPEGIKNGNELDS